LYLIFLFFEPSLVKLFPPLSAEKIRLITQLIKKNYLCRRMSKSYLKMIEKSRDILENEIRSKLGKHCSLTLFGSAKNGFGLNGSDADMCLRRSFFYEVIMQNNNFLRLCALKYFYIVYVTVAFSISLYNELAVVNTRLLRTYCDLDRRVQELGIALKQWAKMCNIGDASKGSLSSYSYIIMLIHFLQRTNPPVLPFLQEVYLSLACEYFHMVEGWDTFFYKPNELQWKTSNDETVGLLWVQFLDFYTKKFDFANEVVQIRQRNSLLKLNKGWELKPMAIEDPFNLDHNLSSGLQYKSKEITFIYAKKHFFTTFVYAIF
uniref:PAP-associated domain-containing protein n=1 Tax=Syphacia muris TaxID=451379 RepID=A0A0N5B158_9BILA